MNRLCGTIVHTKMPDRYYQKARERKRDLSIQLSQRIGGESRHIADPEGSAVWVETGIWPEEMHLDR